jgi:predicted alpha/beta-fold hydrolase
MWWEATPRFVPHPWFRGPHQQTIAGALLWRRRNYPATAHTLTLADGDRLIVHENVNPVVNPTGRSVLLVHGLAGCHQSGYMLRVADKLARAGHRVFRLDQRGCGAGMTLARSSLHAGRTQDLAAAVEFVVGTSRSSRVTVVGFSLGASILLKWLGSPALTPESVDSAIAVAPPLDLQACSRNLTRGWNRIYDRNFTRTLCRIVEQRRRLVPEMATANWSRIPRTLCEFDQHFTAPLGGFRDVEHYYRTCSCLDDLPQIRIPTRILFAEDDPLIPGEVFQRARFSTTTRVYLTAAGGHLGFLAQRLPQSPDADWHWMDWRVVDWVGETGNGGELGGEGAGARNAESRMESGL